MAVAKVDTDKNLYTQTIPVNRKVLVVGAGIAGIQAALDVADAGFPDHTVDAESLHRRQNGQTGQNLPHYGLLRLHLHT